MMDAENTYAFIKNNKKITLIPLTLADTHEPEPNLNIEPTVTLTNLLKAEHHEFQNQKYLILTQPEEEEKPKPKHNHPLLTSLLEGFKEVFPTEIPPGLPPPRGIQHKIDLIQGVVLPNKRAYRIRRDSTASW